MARYSEQQKAALDALMKDSVYEKAIAIMTGEDLQELTMERLAQEVGVSRGTIYNYFADREAVIEFVIDRTFEPLKRAIGDLSGADLPPVEKLTRIVEWIFETVGEDRALVVALAPAKQASCAAAAHRARHRGFIDVVEEIIREGVAGGDFRDLDPALVSEILFGAVRGMIDSMVETGEFLPPEKVVPVFNGILLAGLCSPGAANAESDRRQPEKSRGVK